MKTWLMEKLALIAHKLHIDVRLPITEKNIEPIQRKRNRFSIEHAGGHTNHRVD